MGFYGNITNASNTSFSFDKIYPNRFIMDSKCDADGISVGRFVLVEYETEAVVGNNGLSKPKEVIVTRDDNNNPSAVYLNNSEKPQLKFVENNASEEWEVTYGEVVKTQEDGKNIYLICTGGTESEDSIAVFNDLAISDEAFTNYNINYQTDFLKYKKNYDSTVWTKTATEKGFKYVQIAELNGVVPTFALSVEAPTEEPLAPYFDGDSNNVYYDLHVQPSWGFRVAQVEENGLSDENGLDIYYNRAGFNPQERSYIEGVEDEISITPDGQSGREYEINDMESDGKSAAPDIQQLHIILPSIGNTISDIWDVVYGEKRKLNFEWLDLADRELNTKKDEKTYALDTVAGCINSVHTLMGEIIKTVELNKGVQIVLEQAEYLEKEQVNSSSIEEDILYSIIQDGKKYYYRAYKKPVLEEITDPTKITEGQIYYVTWVDSSKPTGYSVGDKWNANFKVIPNNIKLSEHVKENGVLQYNLCYKKVPMINDHIVSLYGWILKLDEIINGSSEFDRDDKSIKGILNSIKDLVSLFDAERLTDNALMAFNASGKITPMELNTAQSGTYVDWGNNNTASYDEKNDVDRWITYEYGISAQEYIGFKKYFAENFGAFQNYFNCETFTEGGPLYVFYNLKEKSESNSGPIAFSSNEERTEYVVTKNGNSIVCIYDEKGKKVREMLLTTTKESNEQSGLVLQYITDANEKITPYPYADGIHADAHGQYLFYLGKHNKDNTFPEKINVYENIDTLRLNHNYNEVEDKTSELNFNDITDSSLEIPLPIVDSMGHIVGKHTKEVTLPYGYSHIQAGNDNVDPKSSTDTLKMTGNDWIEISGDNNEKEIIVAHKVKKDNAEEFSVFNHGENQQIATPKFEIDAAGHLKQSGTDSISTKQDFSYINLGTGKTEKEDEAKEGVWIDMNLVPQFSFVGVNINEYKAKFVTGKIRDLFYFDTNDKIVGTKMLEEDEIKNYATLISTTKNYTTYVRKISEIENTGVYTYSERPFLIGASRGDSANNYSLEKFLGIEKIEEIEEAKNTICSIFLCNREVSSKIDHYKNSEGKDAPIELRKNSGAGLHIGHNYNKVEDTVTYSSKSIPKEYNYLGEFNFINEVNGGAEPNLNDLVEIKTNQVLRDTNKNIVPMIAITNYFNNLFSSTNNIDNPNEYYFNGIALSEIVGEENLNYYSKWKEKEQTRWVQLYYKSNETLIPLTSWYGVEIEFPLNTPTPYIPTRVEVPFVNELNWNLPFTIYIARPPESMELQYQILTEEGISGRYWWTGIEWAKASLDGNGLNAKQSELSLYTPIIDNTGHIIGHNTEYVTMPRAFGKINVKGYSKNTVPLKATSFEDDLIFEGDNQWIDLVGQSGTGGNKIKIKHKTISEELGGNMASEGEGVLTEEKIPITYSQSLLPKEEVNDNLNTYYSIIDYFTIYDKEDKIAYDGKIVFATLKEVFDNPERYGQISSDFLKKNSQLLTACEESNIKDKDGNEVVVYRTTIFVFDAYNEKKEYVKNIDTHSTLTREEINICQNYSLEAEKTYGFIFMKPSYYKVVNNTEEVSKIESYFVKFERGEGKNQWVKIDDLQLQENTLLTIPSIEVDSAGHINSYKKLLQTIPASQPSILTTNSNTAEFSTYSLPKKKVYFDSSGDLKLEAKNKWIRIGNTNDNTIEILHAPSKNSETNEILTTQINDYGKTISTNLFKFDKAGHIEKVGIQTNPLYFDKARFYDYQNENNYVTTVLVDFNFDKDIDTTLFDEEGNSIYRFTEDFKTSNNLSGKDNYGVYYIFDNEIKKIGTVGELDAAYESLFLGDLVGYGNVYISDQDLDTKTTAGQLANSISSEDSLMEIIKKLENRIMELEKRQINQ